MYPQIFNVYILICYEDIYKSEKHLVWESLKQYEECDISWFGVRNEFLFEIGGHLGFWVL